MCQLRSDYERKAGKSVVASTIAFKWRGTKITKNICIVPDSQTGDLNKRQNSNHHSMAVDGDETGK